MLSNAMTLSQTCSGANSLAFTAMLHERSHSMASSEEVSEGCLVLRVLSSMDFTMEEQSLLPTPLPV